jgi:hypothetical protein
VTSDNTPGPDDAPTEPRHPGQAFADAIVAAYRPVGEAMIAFGRQVAAELRAAEMRRRAAEQKAPSDGPSATEDDETPLPGTPVTLETIQDISAGPRDADRPAYGRYRITAVDGGDEVICYPINMARGRVRLIEIENADELQRCIADHEKHDRGRDPVHGETPCDWATIMTRRDATNPAKSKPDTIA